MLPPGIFVLRCFSVADAHGAAALGTGEMRRVRRTHIDEGTDLIEPVLCKPPITHAFLNTKTIGFGFVRTNNHMPTLVFIEPVLNGRRDAREFSRIDDNETRKGGAVISQIGIEDRRPAKTTHFPPGQREAICRHDGVWLGQQRPARIKFRRDIGGRIRLRTRCGLLGGRAMHTADQSAEPYCEARPRFSRPQTYFTRIGAPELPANAAHGTFKASVPPLKLVVELAL